MGYFSTLSVLYVVFAFLFQFVSITFIALDKRCNNRIIWGITTLFTGPLGVLAYAIKGRKN